MNIQLHAHHLHNNNCWGINCVIIPAPMVIVRTGTDVRRISRSYLKTGAVTALENYAQERHSPRSMGENP